MNAYERRIIHAEIQKIEGVSTNSVGTEGNRRVIIFPEGAAKPTEMVKPEKKNRSNDRRKGGKRSEKSANAERRPSEKKENSENRKTERKPEGEVRTTYKRPDTPRPAPRKIEKAKDLDSYFAKLKEFSSNNPQ
jgi:spoIIIJ-associated protein